MRARSHAPIGLIRRSDVAGPPDLYAAYGSNLLPVRLQRRTPSARFLGCAALPGHQLAFGKRGQDGSGKCWLRRDDTATAQVAVFEVARVDRQALDRFEGLGDGYERELVDLQLADGRWQGRRVSAYVYMATPSAIDEALRPFDWYRDLVLAGARHHRFATSLVRWLGGLPVAIDADRARQLAARDLLAGPPDLHG
ncbi:MAG: gamma-glutamylcyclotransferase family protein [Burkholderiaceae bacterium]